MSPTDVLFAARCVPGPEERSTTDAHRAAPAVFGRGTPGAEQQTIPLHSRTWAAMRTTVTVVVQDAPLLDLVAGEIQAEVAAFDSACSRFDPAS
ncbi:MAG: hypothetical protein M0Z87_02575 [Actinomycetota bacterium]|nr:hypothetical protein [Actinomycetota bacterium]